MAASASQTAASIAPGSTAYGERAPLEQGIMGSMGGGGGAGGPGGAPTPALPAPENPLGALISGQVQTGDNGPLTSGLSYGPGPGPVDLGADPMMSDRANRVRALATQAVTPQLRALARAELRRMAREPI